MIPANILIVEDERVVALHLRQQLTRLGYHVPAMATAGQQALRQIEQIRPDIVLMDIHIEGDLDGIETAAQIPPGLQIPVIYLSAYSEESTLERARATGPYGYLLKPFSERELHAAIQMVLERRRADSLAQESSQRLAAVVEERTRDLMAANEALAEETNQRISAERNLLQSQKMDAVGQLTGGVAHDFNNLMQIVVGNLDVLIRTLPEESELHRLALKALGGAKRASDLTQRLLAFSRRQPLTPMPVNTNELILGMSDLVRRALGETIVIETKLCADLWAIESDHNQLESAILNLALNSRDAMAEGGTLTIETSNVSLDAANLPLRGNLAAGDYVVLTVSDTGHGMDEKTLSCAFDPFFTTKEVGVGTGLGLSQVYSFVKQSHGYVTIRSQVGEGSSVEIFLPRYTGPKPVVEPQVMTIPDQPVTGTEAILVVEDDPEVREFSIDVLSSLGYRVLEAADGPAALQILNRKDVHLELLFSDVVLPGGMNGAALASKAVALRPPLKVLFTTGYARDAFTRNGTIAHGIDLITKPFTSDELAMRVRRVLDGSMIA